MCGVTSYWKLFPDRYAKLKMLGLQNIILIQLDSAKWWYQNVRLIDKKIHFYITQTHTWLEPSQIHNVETVFRCRPLWSIDCVQASQLLIVENINVKDADIVKSRRRSTFTMNVVLLKQKRITKKGFNPNMVSILVTVWIWVLSVHQNKTCFVVQYITFGPSMPHSG